MVSWTEFLFGEDEMVLEVKTGDSCTATLMNLMSLNCAPKNAVFYHQFLKVVGIPKDCPETLLS